MKTSKLTMKTTFKAAIVGLAMLAGTAFALDLSSAKSQGWLGEQRDGYLGLVRADAPPEARQLLEQVNRQRRTQFEQIAARNGISVNDAAAVFAREAAERTQAGNYIQGPQGWVKK
jgi:uncharacterized protein